MHDFLGYPVHKQKNHKPPWQSTRMSSINAAELNIHSFKDALSKRFTVLNRKTSLKYDQMLKNHAVWKYALLWNMANLDSAGYETNYSGTDVAVMEAGKRTGSDNWLNNANVN